VPAIVIGAVWKLMYDFDFGIVNQLLGLFGLPPQGWLASTSLALGSVIAVDVWHWTPFVYLLMLAGLAGMPEEVIEAGKIDGASGWQLLTKVVLPLMMPTIIVTLVFRAIIAFKVFDEIYLLTDGGPGAATEVVSFTIFRRFFSEDQPGYGAAMSIAALLVLTLLIVIGFGLVRRRSRSW
jgi:multiple sugar transport system permease protein